MSGVIDMGMHGLDRTPTPMRYHVMQYGRSQHSLMMAPRSMAPPAFSWMEVKMRAAAPTAFSA